MATTTLYWVDADHADAGSLSWSDLHRYRYSPDDIPVLGHSALSYGDYDNSGAEERSNVRVIRENDTADQDSVWWEVYGNFGSRALVLRLPGITRRWMEFVAGQQVHRSLTGIRFPFGTNNERDAEVWGKRIAASLISRMWSRNGHNLPSDAWDDAAEILEVLEEHIAYDEDDAYRMQEEMVLESWESWGWSDFTRDLTDAGKQPEHWSDHLAECLEDTLPSRTEPSAEALEWLMRDGDLDHGVEGGGNVYFRWDRHLTEVWDYFEDHGTLPWDAPDKTEPITDPAQLTLEV